MSAAQTAAAGAILPEPAQRPLSPPAQVDTVPHGGSPEANGTPTRRSASQTAVIMASLCAAVFVAALDVTIITTALPTMAQTFGDATGYQWIGSGYVLPHTASVPSWGKFSDIWGRKPVILVAGVVFLAGSLLCALVQTFPLFLFGRAVQGLGAAGLITLVNICISDLFSLRDRGLYFGLISLVWAVASGAGPVLGGAFTDKLTWRWCFWINVPITSTVFVLIFFFLQLKTETTPAWEGLRAVDWIGTLLVSGSTLMVLLGLDFGGVTHPWDSATVICLIVFGVVAAALFVTYEGKRARFPVVPVQLFHHRSNVAAFAVCFCHGYVFMGIAYYLPLYLQAVLGTSPLTSGVYLLPYVLSVSVSAALTGAFIQKTGKYIPAVYLGLALLVAGTGLLISLGSEPEWAKIVGYQIVAGFGVGLNFEGPLLAIQAVMGVEYIATATSTMGFVRTMSTAVSIVVGGVVFQNTMNQQYASLDAIFGPQVAKEIGSGNILANLGVIATLPQAQRDAARTAITKSMKAMWIMYTAFAGAAFLAGLFIGTYHLSTEDEATATQPQPDSDDAREKRAARPQEAGVEGCDEREAGGLVTTTKR